MQLTVERVATYGPVTSNSRMFFREVSPRPAEADFSVFGTKEIRDVLKSKAHCLHAGFPVNHVIIMTLNEIRKHYILRVGLPTYLNQMLGEASQVQIQYCTLYTEDNRRIELHLNGNYQQPLQRFIAKHFPIDRLPFKIEIRRDSNPDRVEVRYL